MGQRGVDIHGLHGLGNLLRRRLELHGAGVVQTVRNFDEDDPDVLAHGHEHLPQILHLLLFQGGILHAGQLGYPLHQLRHHRTKALCYLIVGAGGVFNAIMEQRSQNGVGVQAHFRHNLRHRQGMNDIGRAVLPLLPLVLLLGIAHRLVNELHIRARHTFQDRTPHGLIMFGKGFHDISSLSAAADTAWCRSG